MSTEPTDQRSYDIVAPDPAALIESLRAFGYTTATAIADLIDNSITARAKNPAAGPLCGTSRREESSYFMRAWSSRLAPDPGFRPLRATGGS